MGRTRLKSKKKTVIASQAEPSDRPGQSQPSIDSLLSKAQGLISQCDYDLAYKFVQRILERSPHNSNATELLGLVHLEKGELAEAKAAFESLLPGAPHAPTPTPPAAPLYLAQLSEDDPNQALIHYQAAVDLMMAQLKGKVPAKSNDLTVESEDDIKRNIIRVLIAMVEIWMAPEYDLCFDPNAEETCENLLKQAFSIDPENTEALICLSSLRLSQQRPEEAKGFAAKAWLAWKDLDADDALVPPISTRFELAKRFIELSEYEPALHVLQSIMATDDQEVEAWYLEGWCFFIMAEQAKGNNIKIQDLSWEELARDSRDCLETCQMIHTNQEHPDKQVLEHTDELISQLGSWGIQPSTEDAEEDADGWEDVEDVEDSDVEME